MGGRTIEMGEWVSIDGGTGRVFLDRLAVDSFSGGGRQARFLAVSEQRGDTVSGTGNGRAPLGINGLGRIGKLSLWYHLDRDNFEGFVVNLGRPVGRSLGDVAQYLEKDSTYGSLCRYLYGHRAKPGIRGG